MWRASQSAVGITCFFLWLATLAPASAARSEALVAAAPSIETSVAPSLASAEIPYTLLLTGAPQHIWDLQPDIKANIQRMVDMNPNLVVRYFGDAACEQYLLEHYDEMLQAAFARAERGAYRGDICRAAVLAREGGFYVDADLQLAQPLRSLVAANTTFMSVWSYYGGIMNALIGVSQGNPILEATLDQIRLWYSPSFSELSEMNNFFEAVGEQASLMPDTPAVRHEMLSLDAKEHRRLPKATLPMGPLTLLRGLVSAVKGNCPQEASRLQGCGQEGSTVDGSTWGKCVSQEPQWNCGSNQSIRLFGEDMIVCGGQSRDNILHTDAGPTECPVERQQGGWPTQFGVFRKEYPSRTLVGWSHMVGCATFGCGTDGDKATAEKTLSPEFRGMSLLQRGSRRAVRPPVTLDP